MSVLLAAMKLKLVLLELLLFRVESQQGPFGLAVFVKVITKCKITVTLKSLGMQLNL